MKSFRVWLSIITGVVLVILVITAWPEIEKAAAYLSRVNLWVLGLLIPVQIISYFATGEALFSYLRRQGSLKGLRFFDSARMSLEFNFVNHVLPSGGAAGFTYTGWKLSHFGVSAGASTMGQLVRFMLTFTSFITILVIAGIILIVMGDATPLVLGVSVTLIVVTILAITFFVFVAGNKQRLDKFAGGVRRAVNAVVRVVTFKRKQNIIGEETIGRFTHDIHTDFTVMKANRKVLIVPLLWTFVANIADVSLFFIAFSALGYPVFPAVMIIAYGLSSIVGIIMVTPGGAGLYEAVMIGFLASAGVSADIAIAGTLLARVILLLGTIVFGYLFYQMTILKYGKSPTPLPHLKGHGGAAAGDNYTV